MGTFLKSLSLHGLRAITKLGNGLVSLFIVSFTFHVVNNCMKIEQHLVYIFAKELLSLGHVCAKKLE